MVNNNNNHISVSCIPTDTTTTSSTTAGLAQPSALHQPSNHQPINLQPANYQLQSVDETINNKLVDIGDIDGQVDINSKLVDIHHADEQSVSLNSQSVDLQATDLREGATIIMHKM